MPGRVWDFIQRGDKSCGLGDQPLKKYGALGASRYGRGHELAITNIPKTSLREMIGFEWRSRKSCQDFEKINVSGPRGGSIACCGRRG